MENRDKSHEIRDFRLYFLDKDMENCIIRLEHNDAKRQEEEIYMNKTELVAAIAERAELSKKDSEKALKAFVDVVAEELKKMRRFSSWIWLLSKFLKDPQEREEILRQARQ